MSISDKLNEIEEQTKMLAQQAQVLEENKRNYEGLLECEVHDHLWKLGGVVSSLREVFSMDISCERCGSLAVFGIATQTLSAYQTDGPLPHTSQQPLPIEHHTGVYLSNLIPEEDE